MEQSFEEEESRTEGLTSAQAEEALAKYGFNEVERKEPWWGWKVVARYLGIVPLVMLVAAVLSVSVETTCEEEEAIPDNQENYALEPCQCKESIDVISCVLLLFELNLVVWVDYLGEQSSTRALAELKRLSMSTASVKRNGAWVIMMILSVVYMSFRL